MIKVACQAIGRLILFYSAKDQLNEKEELFVAKLTFHLKKIRRLNSEIFTEEAKAALSSPDYSSQKNRPPQLRQQTEGVIRSLIHGVKVGERLDHEATARTNVQSNQLCRFLWKSTFDPDLRYGLSDIISTKNLFDGNERDCETVLNLIASHCTLSLSIEAVELLKNEIHGFFITKRIHINEAKCLRAIVFFNQPQLMQNVTKDCAITPEIIEVSSRLTMDELSDLLQPEYVINNPEFNSYNFLRAYQRMDRDTAVESMYKFALEKNLFQMQLWLVKTFHSIKVDHWPLNFITALREEKKPNIVSVIQEVTNIIAGSNMTMSDVIKNGMNDVALAWVILMGTIENCDHLDATYKFFNETYPIIGESIPLMERTITNSNIYKLIHENFPFNPQSIFLWQSLNPYCDSEHSMPHFSNYNLRQVPGLQFTPLILYFLKEGRPSEAFRTCGNETDSTSNCCFKFESIEVSASNVILNELMNGNSCKIRLITAAASRILEYSRPFLGLKSVHQELELNRLIRKSLVSNEESSKIKLLQLLVQSIRIKFKNNNFPTVEEAVDWDLVIKFCKSMSLDPPLDFLVKCADSDDWLLFTVFAQLNDIDKELVMQSLSNFNNQCIADHLKKAFDSSSCLESSSTPAIVKVNRRTTAPGLLRTTLYNKIGLQNRNQGNPVVERVIGRKSQGAPSTIGDENDMRSVTSEDVTNVETISFFSGNSGESNESNAVIEWPFKDLKLLYDGIIYCSRKYSKMMEKSLMTCGLHNRNHVFVLLSASLNVSHSESSSLSQFESLYWWLYLYSGLKVSSDGPTLKNVSDILLFLSDFLKLSRGLYLFKLGLDLFGFSNSPITLLLQFMIEFLTEKEFHKNVSLLKLYQEEFWRLDSNCNPLLDRETVARISVIIFVNCIRGTSSNQELKILLRHLDFSRVQNMFPEEIIVPDIRRLYRMVQTVSEIDSLNLNAAELLSPSSQINEDAVVRVVDSLQEKGYFSEAINFANAAGIDMNTVLFKEWRMKVSHNIDDFYFWIMAFGKLRRRNNRNVIISLINDFIDQVTLDATKTLMWIEKCIHLNFSYTKDSNPDLKERIIESEKSLVSLLLQIQVDRGNEQSSKEYEHIWKLLAEDGSSLFHETSSLLGTVQLTPEEVAAVESIITKLVSINLELAQRFSDIFNHQSEQLQLVKVCDALARKRPDALDFLPSSMAAIFPKEGIEIKSNNFILSILERLSNHPSGSKIACQQICLYFKISNVIKQPFVDVKSSQKDPFAILQQLIKVGSIESYNLAKELITVNKLGDEPISEVICTELITALRTELPEVSESSSTSEPGINNFLSQLRLLNDTSILGRLILKRLKESSIDNQPMYVVVELYIKAHDCFTMASDIEGIATILRNVKVLIVQHLTQRGDFNSMIRLLMGIGRYSEMTYIFDLLKEHHKFELLLGRKIERVPQLRVALIDSIKGDKEMYPMVALNFSMHREIADMLQLDALKIIRSFSKQMSPVVRDLLERSLADLVDASESYSKASCYSQSRRCAMLAQLVALQISYLDSDLIVLNLSPAAVAEFISNHDNFVEVSLILFNSS